MKKNDLPEWLSKASYRIIEHMNDDHSNSIVSTLSAQHGIKVKNAKKFIAKGDKVKFTIRFKGRELQHSHLGNELMTKIKEDMKDIGKVELHPKFDGKQMIMVIQPL